MLNRGVFAVVVTVALGVTGTVRGVPAASGCERSTAVVGGVRQVVPASQDVKFGQCLFNSPTDFNQVNPGALFASCSGCHPDGRTDRGTHPVIITNSLGTVEVNRQAPNLVNVQFNVPLGWDGRYGGRLGDAPSIIAAIQSAAVDAINSPAEMGGSIDPLDPVDQAKLDAVAAFLMSRSPTAPPATPPSRRPRALPLRERQRIKVGADVFFGRSASTQGLLAAGKACVSCHMPPFFTDNKVQTNVLHPDAAYDFGFAQRDGSRGPQDIGAGLTAVADPATGRSVQVGTFKTPSLHLFYPDGHPALHSGVFADDDTLFRFYERSLQFTLGPGEALALHTWLLDCPRGPNRHPSDIPQECN
jgi:cytochrome c peroxidase